MSDISSEGSELQADTEVIPLDLSLDADAPATIVEDGVAGETAEKHETVGASPSVVTSPFPFLSNQPLVHVLPAIEEPAEATAPGKEAAGSVGDVILVGTSQQVRYPAFVRRSELIFVSVLYFFCISLVCLHGGAFLAVTEPPFVALQADASAKETRPATASFNYLLIPQDNIVLVQQLFRREAAVAELRKRGTLSINRICHC